MQADVVVEDHNVSVQGLLLDTTKGVSDVAFQEKDWHCDGIFAGNQKVIVSYQ